MFKNKIGMIRENVVKNLQKCNDENIINQENKENINNQIEKVESLIK